ncbi:MAG: hypothetical protein HUJ63_14000 [Enterococcus sp.]|nr:hypothetical protein [Enterococcus sp.]
MSTIPRATTNAILSVENPGTIIIGGMDRGIDYTELIEFIMKNRKYNYVLSYESGRRILSELENSGMKEGKGLYYADDLAKSVEIAKNITERGRAIIFSPAAASYGYFKDFEERGKSFKDLIK